MLGKVIRKRKWEVVLVQEHYRKRRKIGGYRKAENEDKAKTMILVKELQFIEQRRWSGNNAVAITVMANKNGETLTVVLVYIEPNREWKKIELVSLFTWAEARRW